MGEIGELPLSPPSGAPGWFVPYGSTSDDDHRPDGDQKSDKGGMEVDKHVKAQHLPRSLWREHARLTHPLQLPALRGNSEVTQELDTTHDADIVTVAKIFIADNEMSHSTSLLRHMVRHDERDGGNGGTRDVDEAQERGHVLMNHVLHETVGELIGAFLFREAGRGVVKGGGDESLNHSALVVGTSDIWR